MDIVIQPPWITFEVYITDTSCDLDWKTSEAIERSMKIFGVSIGNIQNDFIEIKIHPAYYRDRTDVEWADLLSTKLREAFLKLRMSS